MVLCLLVISFLTAGCQNADFTSLKSAPMQVFKPKEIFNLGGGNGSKEQKSSTKALNEIIDNALADQNEGTDFKSAIAVAINRDPLVISLRRNYEAKLAAIDSSEARKNYKVTSILYGGIEDVTDNSKGVALGLNASRLIFDGGLLDAEIASKGFQAEAAKYNLQATINDRALRLGQIWLELEKYKRLQERIDDRLAILDPLIDNLEQVANAGIGDVSKVTAAQRTVSGIRVTQTNVSESLAKAELDFMNAYGSISGDISYDAEFIGRLVPNKIDENLAHKSPAVLAKYANYKAAMANLDGISAKDNFNVGFEARALRPLVGSGHDSDESLGLVARKTLFNGGMFESETSEATLLVDASLADVKAIYRQGARAIKSAQQTIESMEKAIGLARENAKVTSDEIVYLRQQLIIGASTLDSVLSAEARLYEVESQEINFIADKRKAELLIASTTGLLSRELDIK